MLFFWYLAFFKAKGNDLEWWVFGGMFWELSDFCCCLLFLELFSAVISFSFASLYILDSCDLANSNRLIFLLFLFPLLLLLLCMSLRADVISVAVPVVAFLLHFFYCRRRTLVVTCFHFKSFPVEKEKRREKSEKHLETLRKTANQTWNLKEGNNTCQVGCPSFESLQTQRKPLATYAARTLPLPSQAPRCPGSNIPRGTLESFEEMARDQRDANPTGDQVGGWVYFSFYQRWVF